MLEKFYGITGAIILLTICFLISFWIAAGFQRLRQERFDSKIKDELKPMLANIDRYCYNEFPEVSMLAQALALYLDKGFKVNADSFREEIRRERDKKKKI